MGRKRKESKVEWVGIDNLDKSLLKGIKQAVDNTYEYYHQISDAKEGLKEIFEDINSKTGIPARLFNFLGKSNYLGNGEDSINKNTELKEIFDKIEELKDASTAE